MKSLLGSILFPLFAKRKYLFLKNPLIAGATSFAYDFVGDNRLLLKLFHKKGYAEAEAEKLKTLNENGVGNVTELFVQGKWHGFEYLILGYVGIPMASKKGEAQRHCLEPKHIEELVNILKDVHNKAGIVHCDVRPYNFFLSEVYLFKPNLSKLT